jgi:hypothetical protein
MKAEPGHGLFTFSKDLCRSSSLTRRIVSFFECFGDCALQPRLFVDRTA